MCLRASKSQHGLLDTIKTHALDISTFTEIDTYVFLEKWASKHLLGRFIWLQEC